jgi:glycosyltransferase involved in cell wall biosynthesis
MRGGFLQRHKTRPGAAPIGVALIARDAEHTLPKTLDSLRPYVAQIVVGVDERTTDRTAKVAKKHGADVVQSIQVSATHTCEYHGSILAQDFAAARNRSFELLDKSLPWWLWVDADDEVRNADQLGRIVDSTPEPHVGVWLPYDYARVADSEAVTTTFGRERILRTRVGWEWKYRVHEVVIPQSAGPWIRTDQVRIVHQHNGHKTEDSAHRNLLLLEIEYEERPEDPRTTFYLGNTYFALGNWAAAINWYERYCAPGFSGNHFELWQSYLYLGKAYQKAGQLDGALRAAFGALEVDPTFREPYYALAECYAMSGENEKVIFWTERAKERGDVPFFVFKNPLDDTFNSHMPVADALARMGEVTRAREELEAAYAVHPAKELEGPINHYRGLEQARDEATAFARLAHGKADAEIVSLWNLAGLSEQAKGFGRARDLAIPAMLRQRPNTQPRIVFWCGRGLEHWAPPSLDVGIGGSETAVIKIAERFARDGWRVDVFNGAGRLEGEYDGVGYWDLERYASTHSEVHVSWRQPQAWRQASADARLILWMHDLNRGPVEPEDLLQWHAILGVSSWHAEMLRTYYGVDADYVPNGIDLQRFDPEMRKVPWRCVYASSPDRGLIGLLKLWPLINQGEPGAELHVAYGWQNADKMIAMGDQGLANLKRETMALVDKTPRVVWRDRLGQQELADLYSSAYAWLYPTQFLETSCISAMEAMAGGAIPVTSAVGALPTTIGTAGVLVDGQPHSRAWGQMYVHTARGILASPDVRKPLEYAARNRALSYTWDASFERWKGIVEGLLSGQREAVAA